MILSKTLADLSPIAGWSRVPIWHLQALVCTEPVSRSSRRTRRMLARQQTRISAADANRMVLDFILLVLEVRHRPIGAWPRLSLRRQGGDSIPIMEVGAIGITKPTQKCDRAISERRSVDNEKFRADLGAASDAARHRSPRPGSSSPAS